jgi:hypothetical protein
MPLIAYGVSRRRFTRDADKWEFDCEYAKATNRTPTQLINEALDQMEARYPIKRRHATEVDLDTLASKVAAIIASQVRAGTLGGIKDRAS